MIVVTGAAGLLGNSVLRLAVARDLPARGWVRSQASLAALDGLADDPIIADIASQPIEKALENVSTVIHCAARVGIGRSAAEAFGRDNVLATERLAQACRAGGQRLIFVSTVDTLRWGTPSDPGDEAAPTEPTRDTTYAASKRRAEAVVAAEMALGLDAVIVHPAFLIGPWDWKPSSGQMLLAAVRGPLAIAPPGGNDFCHAGAVAGTLLDLACAPARPPSDRYILSGEPMTYAQAFRLMRRVAGRTPFVITAPAPLVRAAGLAGDAVAALTGREPVVNSAAADAACRPHHFTSARAMAEIGYRPRPAEEAIRDAWTWFRERGYA
ncbi:NAD-dependent epimerase/dehydratase family protein [Phreatobacter sp.]|uniref:NAD-dependent epimerase/dehydratase family protein n=1 Tax=Phreatobacter sp. TaxID=1966341 RepID=UPI0022C4F9F5|nr:NAD-dependent epimerase/dehydratase family protein [Phreatobacter sp.]MCZ8313846.1 NAD-dependent epimerase/dehydratase family protein [Phreatobacter sp.]